MKLVIRMCFLLTGAVLFDKFTNATPAQDCKSSPADVIFLLDASTSVWIDNFETMKQFVTNFTEAFVIGPGNVQIGVVTYSYLVRNEFYLNSFTTGQQVKNAINATEFLTGGTRTDMALAFARTQGFTKLSGDRGGVPDILILLTDGQSNDPIKTSTEAQLVHKQNITVIAIGIGQMIDQTELRRVASTAQDVFLSQSFDTLYSISDRIETSICKIDAPTTTAGAGGTRTTAATETAAATTKTTTATATTAAASVTTTSTTVAASTTTATAAATTATTAVTTTATTVTTTTAATSTATAAATLVATAAATKSATVAQATSLSSTTAAPRTAASPPTATRTGATTAGATSTTPAAATTLSTATLLPVTISAAATATAAQPKSAALTLSSSTITRVSSAAIIAASVTTATTTVTPPVVHLSTTYKNDAGPSTSPSSSTVTEGSLDDITHILICIIIGSILTGLFIFSIILRHLENKENKPSKRRHKVNALNFNKKNDTGLNTLETLDF